MKRTPKSSMGPHKAQKTGNFITFQFRVHNTRLRAMYVVKKLNRYLGNCINNNAQEKNSSIYFHYWMQHTLSQKNILNNIKGKLES